MVEFRWIQMSLFLILMLQFPATTGKYSSITARFGHDVTLSCGNVRDGQKNCDSTSWMFTYSTEEPVVLVKLGQIRSKPDRLSVTTNCSLVIKNVTDYDLGLYRCRQFRSGRQHGADIRIDLSVMNITERQDNDKVSLSCSVLDYYPCSHTVEWLYEGKEEISDMEISPGPCSDTVTFPSSHLNQSIYELLKCKVTDVYIDEVQLFTFSPQSSGETATTKSPPTKTTQATTGQDSYVTVTFPQDVTLSCGNVTDEQKDCDSTTWIYYNSPGTVSVLVNRGQIRSKPDRLRVTTNCSLVIKKVTDGDVGRYTCRQFISGRQQYKDVNIHLSVITMTEHEDNDKVSLFCSVLEYYLCRHTVEWLYEGKEEISDMERSPGPCSVNVTFTSSHLNQNIYELLKCKVANVYTDEVQLFTFSPQSSGGAASTGPPPRKLQQEQNAETKTHFLRSIIVSVGLAALLISVVTVNMWIKTKGNKTQMEENTVQNDGGEGEGSVMYENSGDPSASVRLH